MSVMEQLLQQEWDMFHSVNGEDRTSCQEDYGTFCKMRKAQYDVWSEATVAAYLADLEQAKADGVNLARQKYIYMMKNTDPDGYAHFKAELPAADPEKDALIEQIWAVLLEQTQKMRQSYPMLALGGRCLYASEETDWPSVETYQKSELLTFSKATLRSLLGDITALKEQGTDYVYEVQKNSVLCLGYPDLEKAEAAMMKQIFNELGGTVDSCRCCGGDY